MERFFDYIHLFMVFHSRTKFIKIKSVAKWYKKRKRVHREKKFFNQQLFFILSIPLFFCIATQGCSRIIYKYDPCQSDNILKPLNLEKIAIVTGLDGLLDIRSIDNCPDLIFLKPGVEIHLLPGSHQIKVTERPFIAPNGNTIYSNAIIVLKFDASAGHKYEIKHINKGDWTKVSGKDKGSWNAKIIDLGKVN